MLFRSATSNCFFDHIWCADFARIEMKSSSVSLVLLVLHDDISCIGRDTFESAIESPFTEKAASMQHDPPLTFP